MHIFGVFHCIRKDFIKLHRQNKLVMRVEKLRARPSYSGSCLLEALQLQPGKWNHFLTEAPTQMGFCLWGQTSASSTGQDRQQMLQGKGG